MYASGKLAEIVLKACAFDPRARYQTPAHMGQELETVLYSRSEAQVQTMVGKDPSLPSHSGPIHTVPMINNMPKNISNSGGKMKPVLGSNQEPPRAGSNRYPKPPPKKNKWYLYAAALIPIMAAIFILFLVNRNGNQGGYTNVSNGNQGSYANAPDTDFSQPDYEHNYDNTPPLDTISEHDPYSPYYQPEYIYLKGRWYHTSESRLGIIRGGSVITNSEIEPLRFMTSLTKLYLIGDINITDLSPLSGLTSLEVLQLGHYNNLTNLMPLSNLTNMVELYLNGNAIHDLTPLVGLTNLTRLSLQNNQIFDVSPLVQLDGLEYLNLANNQIRDITALSSLPAAVVLNLAGNPIEDWSAVGHVEVVYGRP